MTIEQARKKAIQAGYNWGAMAIPMHSRKANFDRAFLDPLFWQALGKAMGWKHEAIPMAFEDADPEDLTLDWDMTEGWKYHWHRFIDHLAEGHDAESFFATL